MLQTRSDMETELLARLMIANNSDTISPARITEIIQDAYKYCGTAYFWPSLMRARIATAAANTQNLNYDYYDYPPDFLTNSVSRLYIDKLKYEKKAFQDFLDYVDNTQEGSSPPDRTKRYFADYGRQYFVWPNYIGSAPADDLIVWGNVQPPNLANSTDTTIFSSWRDKGNEAIVCRGMAVAMERLDSGLSAQNQQKADLLLSEIWQPIALEQQRAQRLNHPMFQVPDLFGTGSGQSAIGNFNGVDIIF
ncbi:MAG: hypothetical protein KGJ07_01520 [Patescibacteria group bacterium]|nr:hypothetical protein [Patescibacteria group bacterium]